MKEKIINSIINYILPDKIKRYSLHRFASLYPDKMDYNILQYGMNILPVEELHAICDEYKVDFSSVMPECVREAATRFFEVFEEIY